MGESEQDPTTEEVAAEDLPETEDDRIRRIVREEMERYEVERALYRIRQTFNASDQIREARRAIQKAAQRS